MKGQKFLKVTGILMIIGAALSILFGVIIGGVGVLVWWRIRSVCRRAACRGRE